MTAGAIQFCDVAPQFSATDMIGYVAANHSDGEHVIKCLEPALEASGASFSRDERGIWRFRILDVDGYHKTVTTQKLQRRLYMAGATGKKGKWSDEQKAHAKLWAACIATIFEDKEAKALQLQYTKPMMMRFVRPYTKGVLFDRSDETVLDADGAWVSAIRVAYITFAVNNPTWADKALKKAHKSSKQKKWSAAYAIDVLRELVFARNVGIYPHRYHSIAPELGKLYGIHLPVKAAELKTASKFIEASGGRIHCLKSAQSALKSVGHDPGPIDGSMGKMTKAALKAYQIERNKTGLYTFPSTGVFDAMTIKALADSAQHAAAGGYDPLAVDDEFHRYGPSHEPSDPVEAVSEDTLPIEITIPEEELVRSDSQPTLPVVSEQKQPHVVWRIAVALWGFVKKVLDLVLSRGS